MLLLISHSNQLVNQWVNLLVNLLVKGQLLGQLIINSNQHYWLYVVEGISLSDRTISK